GAKATLALDTSFNLKSYQGNVVIVAFNLGKVLKQKDLGELTLQASATGKGTDVTTFSGTIASAEYKKYVYHKLDIKGSMVNKIVKVNLVTEDSSITSNLDLVADLKNSSYKAKGKLTKVDLYDTHFMSSPMTFSMGIDADVQMKTLDSLLGYIKLSKLYFSDNIHNVDMDTLLVNATLNKGVHTIAINSPLFQGGVTGKYSVNELPLLSDYIISKYYDTTKLKRPKLKHTKDIVITFKAGNLSPLTQLFVPQLTALDSINISTSFTKIPEALKLNVSVQKVTYGTNS